MAEVKEKKEKLDNGPKKPNLDQKTKEKFNTNADRADKAKQKIESNDNQEGDGMEDFNNIKNIKDMSSQKNAFKILIKSHPKLTQNIVIHYSEILKSEDPGEPRYDYIRGIRDGFIDSINCNPNIIFPYLTTINPLALNTSHEIAGMRDNLIHQEYMFSGFVDKFPQFVNQCVKYWASVRSSIYKNYETIETQIGIDVIAILDRISLNINRFNSGTNSFSNKIGGKK